MLLTIIKYFIVARWLRVFHSKSSLEKFQNKSIYGYLHKYLHQFSFYNQFNAATINLRELPIIGKETIAQHFNEFNRFSLSRAEALQFALNAENSRNFSREHLGVTVGLSSGSSGRRGIFLADSKERLQWAGTILGRALNKKSLRRILNPFQAPLRIAFFLRANSNLYNTISNRRIDFKYFDLMQPLSDCLPIVNQFQPHILIAPASVLTDLSRKKLNLHLEQIFSVAEVLEDTDRYSIERILHVPVQQIYQCAEGFLGISCNKGNLHLNEEYVFFEKEWIDEDRFYPIITDFSRTSQAFIRYRLDDILCIDRTPCSCGSATTRLKAIEGRSDEVITVVDVNDQLTQLYPDTIRQWFYSLSAELNDYIVIGNENESNLLRIALCPETDQLRNEIIHTIEKSFMSWNLKPPIVEFFSWQPRQAGQKRIRIFKSYSSDTLK